MLLMSSLALWAVLHSSYSFSFGPFNLSKGAKRPWGQSLYCSRLTETVDIVTRLVGARIILKCISNNHSVLYIAHHPHVISKAWYYSLCNYVLRTTFFDRTSITSAYMANLSKPRPAIQICYHINQVWLPVSMFNYLTLIPHSNASHTCSDSVQQTQDSEVINEVYGQGCHSWG